MKFTGKNYIIIVGLVSRMNILSSPSWNLISFISQIMDSIQMTPFLNLTMEDIKLQEDQMELREFKECG